VHTIPTRGTYGTVSYSMLGLQLSQMYADAFQPLLLMKNVLRFSLRPLVGKNIIIDTSCLLKSLTYYKT